MFVCVFGWIGVCVCDASCLCGYVMRVVFVHVFCVVSVCDFVWCVVLCCACCFVFDACVV